VRSVITGLGAPARKDYPRRVFDNVEEAVHWLSESTEQALDAAGFLASLAQLRQRLQRGSEVA
jgi:hypothetical protein